MELLVVLAIISLLATLSAASIGALVASSNLSQGTSILQGELDLARQTAQTLNRPVQLRFLQDTSNTQSQPSFDELQVVVPALDSSEQDQPAQKPVQLPQQIIIADQQNDFGIGTGNGSNSASGNELIGPNSVHYVYLTFMPTGAVTSAATTPVANDAFWTISVVPQNLYRAQGSSLLGLKNYATFYLNAVTGTYTVARP